MPDPAFLLPSARPLASFSAFFTRATFNKDGTCNVVFNLPSEMKPHVVALSDNEGMLLNVKVWETALPDALDELARAVGLPTTSELAAGIVPKQ